LQVNQARKKRAQLALVSHVMLAYENVLKVQKYHNFEVRGQNLYTAKIKHMGQEVRRRAGPRARRRPTADRDTPAASRPPRPSPPI
jgi:hypothetical protein